jgi:hypothetical protein
MSCLVHQVSLRLWAHMSGRAGPTDRSAGLLVGRAHLSGTAETLVGGDPGVPVSLSRDRKACVEAKRSAVAWHPSDDVMTTFSLSALGGRVS